jgi:GAF domain-containing protein
MGDDTHHSNRSNFSDRSDKYARYEAILDEFLLNTGKLEWSRAVEETICLTLQAKTATLWHDIPALQLLYSDRLKRTVRHTDGLVGYTMFAREITITEDAATHSSYCQQIDMELTPPGTPVLLFPLRDAEDNVCAIVEVTREPRRPFSAPDDQDFVRYFAAKFRVFSNWLVRPAFHHEFCLELMQALEVEQYLTLFQRRVCMLFNCRSAEIWMLDTTSRELKRYVRTGEIMDIRRSGIAGDIILRAVPVNCGLNKMMSPYCEAVDGPDEESVMGVPVLDSKLRMKYAVILRGHKEVPVFSMQDERNLRMLGPYLVLALENNLKFSVGGSLEQRNAKESQCVAKLHNTVERLVAGASVKVIAKTLFDGAVSLTDADRAYLFSPVKDTQDLKTEFSSKDLRVPIDRGLIGQVFKNARVVNLADAYGDADFDSALDLRTGYRTKSVLCAPVINCRCEVIGVAQFANRRDGKPFSKLDTSFAQIMMTLCGMLLENQAMFQQSSESTARARSFVDVSRTISRRTDERTVLNEILQNARSVVNAERASVFLLDTVMGVLTTFIADGGRMPDTLPLNNGIAAACVQTKASVLVNDAYHDPRFNKMVDFATGFHTNSVLAVAIVNSDGSVLGVLEMLNKVGGGFTQSDLGMVEAFGTLAGMVLENVKLKEIIARGAAEIELNKWIGEFERKSHVTPIRLKLAPENDIFCLNFFCIDYNGVGLFKVSLTIFSSFGLLEGMKITNGQFFTFLFRMRECYKDPPYHNWLHAVDVLQYFAYQIRLSKSDEILTPLEILSICVAALCHDAGHQGLNNVYNVKAETPLGILFKDQSVMEVFHCSVAIQVISQEETNIFHALAEADIKRVWKWIIHLILATDMAHHFKLVKYANDVLDAGPINLANEGHRLMAMTMLMKVADVSNVSRPFEIAQEWCNLLYEEFWRQGDMERGQGLDVSSPMNDRAAANKASGQIAFYNFICLPLFQVVARIFPELEVNVRAVHANLEKWKEQK